MFARDLMDTRFHTLRPHQSIGEAVRMFHRASEEEGKRIFGLMVTDDEDHLVGMLSMYDILVFVQPKHVHLWGEVEEFEPDSAFDAMLERVKSIQVGDLMTTEVVTVKPDTHFIVIADLRIKRHIRRLPVADGGNVVGIVYVSDVFHRLFKKFV
ncbi:MAG: CBS domain-containing protein [Deltaproteobacteria bacterium]|nr:CBS domain-containing protein [Deltaproteobacteria bacterium]